MRGAASALLCLCFWLAGLASARAAVEIQWWHGMTGSGSDVVESLSREFNQSQSTYRVVPTFKGTYPQTLQAGLAAYRADQAPHIIQVFDVGTGVMMAAEGAIMPVADVLKKGGVTFDKAQYLPGIVSYYSKPDGTMLSFPFNSSSPVLYFNRDAFAKAGLGNDTPLATWKDVWTAARRIKASGAAACGYTSTWLTWIHLENFAAWNDLPYATRENGLAGTDAELLINTPIFVKHFAEMAALAHDGVLRYAGRTVEAKQLFLSGECAIFTDSSGAFGDIVRSGMNYGVGPLPYDETAPGAPQNTIPGGASLWVFAGHSDAEYRGVAEFFKYLSRTDVQARLHQVSGYLPATMAAYEATRKADFYQTHRGFEQPIKQMLGKQPTANSRGVRLIDLPQIRDIENEEIEAMLSGQETAQLALDNAVRRGNEAIKQALRQQQ